MRTLSIPHGKLDSSYPFILYLFLIIFIYLCIYLFMFEFFTVPCLRHTFLSAIYFGSNQVHIALSGAPNLSRKLENFHSDTSAAC